MNQFKRAQIVMLPMENNGEYNSLLFNNNKLIQAVRQTVNKTIQHLYIISDDEIKEGDWTLCLDEIDSTVMNWNINQCIFKHVKGGNCIQCKKIIATTDTSLNLPQPSQQFIEKYIEEYNKSNIIKYVLVEYEVSRSKYIYFDGISDFKPKELLNLKINPKDNTITIKKLKDSWNREEMIEEVTKALYAKGGWYQEEIDKWIEENL